MQKKHPSYFLINHYSSSQHLKMHCNLPGLHNIFNHRPQPTSYILKQSPKVKCMYMSRCQHQSSVKWAGYISEILPRCSSRINFLQCSFKTNHLAPLSISSSFRPILMVKISRYQNRRGRNGNVSKRLASKIFINNSSLVIIIEI